jgi:hypothetical protein
MGIKKNSASVNSLNSAIQVMEKKEILNKIDYVICCVGAFASRFNLSNAQAYAYLRRFTGIDFLLECYAAEHTLSIEDAVEDLTNICLQKGGRIS